MSVPILSSVRRSAAIALAALPLGFGLLRAWQTGTDFRYLTTALVTVCITAVCFRFGASRALSRGLLVVGALVAATTASAVAAFALGARSAGAVWFVSLGFSLCVVGGAVLGSLTTRGARR